LSYVKAVAKGIGRLIASNYHPELFRIVINKSTVPVGSGNWVEMLIREEIRNQFANSAESNSQKVNSIAINSSKEQTASRSG
jgi:UDP-glucose 6-dehydrogenase